MKKDVRRERSRGERLCVSVSVGGLEGGRGEKSYKDLEGVL